MNRMRAIVALLAAAALLAAGCGTATAGHPAAGGDPTFYGCIDRTTTTPAKEVRELYNVQGNSPLPCASGDRGIQWNGAFQASPSPSPTATATASPSPSPTATGGTCTVPIGGSCPNDGQGYQWSGWPGSNGYNTYVMNQSVGPAAGSTGSVTANSPSDWSATGNYTDCGGCVQTFDAVQQLTNNWSADGKWSGSSDVPLSALTSLSVSYTESSPTDAGTQYEFAPDIWTNYAGHLCGGCGDVMMWVDTSAQRCGAVGGWTVLGHPVLAGQDWTVYLAPSGAGDEIILILDGAGGPGTCAQQPSGTIPVLDALKWLSANPGPSGFPAFSSLTMSQLNTGWEITALDGTTFRLSALAYNVTTG